MERTMDIREARSGLGKAIGFVKEGVQQILHDNLDEEHGVSVCPGATAIASLTLLVLGKGYEKALRGGVNWLIQNRKEKGWGKVPGGAPDPEVTRIAQIVVQASAGGLFNKLTLLDQAKQLADLVLTLGRDVVPGLDGPSIEDICLPNILEKRVLEKLPPYGRCVVIAASLLAASSEQQGIEEGIKVIRESQLPDGSWAEDIVGTSLCIMALLRFVGHDSNIHRAGKWLTLKQYPSGGWPAFNQLKNWAIGWSLSILDNSVLGPDTLIQAREWLFKARNEDGSFGTTPPFTHPDLDDTAIVLMALPFVKEMTNPTILLLQRLQNEDGSWGTFPSFNGHLPSIESCKPVYITSLDVTVHVIDALLRQGMTLNDPCILKALRWILSQQKPDGQFQSIWFESEIYGTSQVIDLLGNLKYSWHMLRLTRQVHLVRQRGVDFLLKQCNSKGDWGNSVVETALAISALKIESGRYGQFVFDRAVESMLDRQNAIGSFIPVYQGVYAKGWNYEEPIATALTAIRTLQWYVNQPRR
jgi:hypothetical protein